MCSNEKTYEGCDGPNSAYVKLISCDGHEFFIKRELAVKSGTIKSMLSAPGQFSEIEVNEVNFRDIPARVLQKVCNYFHYCREYLKSSIEIPAFVIEPDMALDLMIAATFLDC